jgi:hypothetical protein
MLCGKQWGKWRRLETSSSPRRDESVVLGKLCLVIGRVLWEEDGDEVKLRRKLR